MGNSVVKEQCVNIENIPEFNEELYTVKRTSGILEGGWILSWARAHGVEWMKKSAYFDTTLNKWRIYTQNGKENPNEWLYGWRDLENIFPTSLEGKKEEIDAWRAKVYVQLEALENKREDEVMKKIAETKRIGEEKTA
jgi:hypothetical protein